MSDYYNVQENLPPRPILRVLLSLEIAGVIILIVKVYPLCLWFVGLRL